VGRLPSLAVLKDHCFSSSSSRERVIWILSSPGSGTALNYLLKEVNEQGE